jgi:hypothetical protein
VDALGAPEAAAAWRMVESATRLRAGWRYRRGTPAWVLRFAGSRVGSPRLWETLERVASITGARGAVRAAGSDPLQDALRLADACAELVKRRSAAGSRA